jgi:hypothetical protein
VFVRAAAGGAHEAAGMAFVDAQQRAVPVAQARITSSCAMVPSIENTPSVNTSVKRAPSAAPLAGSAPGRPCRCACSGNAGLAQADAVDDGGVVEFVADDRVLLAQQRFEQAAVGVERGGVQDGVLGAEETRQARLQRLVQVLRAADETHRTQAVAVGAQGLVRGRHHLRVGRQAEVVVGAQVEHLAACDRRRPACGCARPVAMAMMRSRLVQAGVADGLQFVRDVLVETVWAGHPVGLR